MKTRKGFTLVELLVVISIIAVLLAILMPTLGSAREQGRAIVCGTHMKGLAVSWMVYAMNNNDKLCGAFTYNNNSSIQWGHKWDWVWSPWVKETNMAVAINAIKCTLEQRKEGIKRGAFYKYNEKVEIYQCPGDKTGHLCSFSVPDCLSGMEFEWRGANAKWKVLTKLSQVRSPSSKYVFLEESDSRLYNVDSWEGPDVENMKWRDSVIWWHRGSSNLAFADGHSIKRKWSRETKDETTAHKGGGWEPRTSEGIEDLKYMIAGWAK
jgi:prepilin-type N-terminal cleavage/methylation domain-containing protein/prepilin-type processing-associated H-X9-DG protein